MKADYVTGTSYPWAPIVTARKNCKVKAVAYTVLNKAAGSDISNAAFKVTPGP